MARAPRQLIEQATRHAVYLERLKTGDFNRIVGLLDDIIDEITADLSRHDLTRWSRQRLETQLAAYRQIIEQRGAQNLLPAINAAIFELAQYEAGFEARSLGQVVARDFTLPAEAQVIAAVQTVPLQVTGADGGKLLGAVLAGVTPQIADRITGQIRLGYAQGTTTAQIVRQLATEVAPLSRRSLSGIVRTGLAHAAQQARQATWEANRDIVTGVRWVATLDGRTTTQCRSLDGQVFPIDEGPRPPAHFGCRSTTVAALDERFAFLDEEATRFARDPETGRARIGEVPAGQTYYGWLTEQSAAFQDDVLGPTRGRLLRQGGLSAERFAELQLGRDFRPLTLAEMAEREPLAFERAGIDI